MDSSISIPENLEVLQQIFEKTQTLFTGSKKKKSKAKKKFKKAEDAEITSLELHILKWTYKKAKHRHKAHKAAYKIAKKRLKHAASHANKAEVAVESVGESTRLVSNGSKEHLKKHAKQAEVLILKKDKKHHHKNHKEKDKKTGISELNVSEVKAEKKAKKSAKQVEVSSTSQTPATVTNKNPKKITSVVDKVTFAEIPTTTVTTAVSIIPVVTTSKQVVANPTSTVNYESNDLTLIEGIGKKVAQILNDERIGTFSRLSTASLDELNQILRKNRLQMMNPATWAEQAKLIVDGKFDELKHLQEVLKGGRRV